MSDNIQDRMKEIQTVSNLMDEKVEDPKKREEIKKDLGKLTVEQVRDKHNL